MRQSPWIYTAVKEKNKLEALLHWFLRLPFTDDFRFVLFHRRIELKKGNALLEFKYLLLTRKEMWISKEI